jgi:hypothetical protein
VEIFVPLTYAAGQIFFGQHQEWGSGPRQPAHPGKVVSRKGMWPIGNQAGSNGDIHKRRS